MEREHSLRPLHFLIVFVVLFLLSIFATSYRKSVQAAIPVLHVAMQNTVLPTPKSPEVQQRTQPPPARTMNAKLKNKRTMDKVIKTLSQELRPRLRETFISKGVAYPPPAVTLIALKEEKRIEIWSPDASGEEQLVLTYPILGESGTLGPKLRQGDLQVPEGFYRILWFNPESEFYLSLKLNYPNTFDQRMAKLDGRTTLGGDIFIHGYDVSLGCLAIGNPAIEEVFLLVYDTGKKNTRIIITPYDFRVKTTPASGIFGAPQWADILYRELKSELLLYTRESQTGRTG